MHIAERILLNTASSWLAKLISIGIAIVLVPMLLAALGQYDYGLWVSIGQGIAFLALLDLGIANTVSRFVAKADALGDEEDKRGVFSVAMLVFWVAAAVVFALVLVLAPFIPTLLRVEPQRHEVSTIMFLMLGTRVALTFPLRVGRGLLQSKDRYGYISLVTLAGSLLQFVLVWITVYWGRLDLIVLCSIAIVCNIATEWFLYRRARKLHPTVRFDRSALDRDRFSKVFSLGASAVVHSGAGLLYQRGQVLAVGVVLGMAAAPLFSIPNTFLLRVGGLIGRTGATFLPIASRAAARGEHEKLVTLSIYGTRYGLLLGAGLATYLLLYGRELIALWLRSSGLSVADVGVIHTGLLIMVFPLAVSRANMGNRTILRATGEHWMVANLMTAFAVVSVVTTVVLMKYTDLGVLGAAVGWSVRALLLDGLLLAGLVLQKFHIPLSLYLKRVVFPPLLFSAVVWGLNRAVLDAILSDMPTNVLLVGGTVFYGLSAAVLVVAFGIDPGHRAAAGRYAAEKAQGYGGRVMFRAIENYLLRNTERKQVRASFFYRAAYKIFGRSYKDLYAAHPDRRRVGQLFWGREGGFEHAKAQFSSARDKWYRSFGRFYELLGASLREGDQILEIGCSAGQWADRLGLADMDCRFKGVDINAKSIEFANRQFADRPHIAFTAGHIGDLTGLDTYDLVFSCQTTCFLDRATLEGVLGGMKPASRIVLQEPVNDDWADSADSQLLSETERRSIGFSHNYPRLLEEHGFSIDEQHSVAAQEGVSRLRLLLHATKTGEA